MTVYCILHALILQVRGFYGEKGIGKYIPENILICTIEKSNVLINNFLTNDNNNYNNNKNNNNNNNSKNKNIGILNVGCVVIDELHMMGDPHRGYLLEILIRYVFSSISSYLVFHISCFIFYTSYFIVKSDILRKNQNNMLHTALKKKMVQ